MSTEFDIQKWRIRFAEVIDQMKTGEIDSCMLVTAKDEDPMYSGCAALDGHMGCLAFGVDLAIESAIENGVELFDEDDEDLIDFADIAFGPTMQ